MSIGRSSSDGDTERAPARRVLAATILGAAVAALVVCGASAAALAQGASSKVLDACAPQKREISAEAIPAKVEPSRCPIDGRAVVDDGVSAVVPQRGTGIYAEALTTEGAQELLLYRSEDGALSVARAGDDVAREEALSQSASARSEGEAARRIVPRASSPGECADRARKGYTWRVSHYMRWSFNARSTPSELSKSGAANAIRRGGRNVYDSVNRCRMGDRVPSNLIYEGTTTRSVGISTGARCLTTDGKSVVGFGTLPRGYLGATCTSYYSQDGWDRPMASDIRVNKALYRWTNRPFAPSCRGRYDLESTITHERGHTFGLDHVSEQYHGNLTMSPTTEGACQSSERTLGRGDVLGLWNKFR